MDGDTFPGTEQEYVQGYLAKLNYLNDRLVRLIPDMVARSQRPTVIILQGDHGPGMQLRYDSPEASNLEERLRILCPAYASGGSSEGLESALTPANLFRVLFNQVFEARFPLLRDHSYYSTLEEPLDFIEVPWPPVEPE